MRNLLRVLLLSLVTVFFPIEGTAAAELNGPKRGELKVDPSLSLMIPFDGGSEPATSGVNPVLEGDAIFEPGISDKAMKLDSDLGGCLHIGLEPEQIDLRKGTIMFWFKPSWSGEDPGGKYTLWWITMKGSDKYFALRRSFSTDDPKLLSVSLGDKSGVAVHMTPEFEVGKWVNVAVTWDTDANECALYLNGERKGDAPWPDVSDDAQYVPGVLLLGRYYLSGESTDDPIRSAYDELFVFKRPLSEQEIGAYTRETKPPKE